MNTEDKSIKMDNKVFKRLFGLKKETYEKMLTILKNEYKILHKLGGSNPKLTVSDKLIMMLQYLREYRTI